MALYKFDLIDRVFYALDGFKGHSAASTIPIQSEKAPTDVFHNSNYALK